MLKNIIGREIKLVNINECRLDENMSPILFVDKLVYNNLGYTFEVVDYDNIDKKIAINIGGNIVWLYRNEYIVLIRNLFQ